MLGAVIVNFNGGALLDDAIASVIDDVDRVVVVDNASSDGSADSVVRRWQGDPRFKLLQRAANGGFAVACNEGFRWMTEAGARSGSPECCPEAVLFLNPDARCLDGCVAALLRELRADSRTAIVGAILLDGEGRELGGARRGVPSPWPAFVRASGLWRLSPRWPRAFPDLHQSHLPLPRGAQDVGAVSGACFVARGEAFMQVNGFDEAFFLHCEDLDLCARVARAGWRVRIVPSARTWHAMRGSTGGRTLATEWHKHVGMVRYCRKHLGDTHGLLMSWLIAGGVWTRFAAFTPWWIAASAFRRGRRHVSPPVRPVSRLVHAQREHAPTASSPTP
jgi:GT2 family glycosyltransferase